jgi:parallel beta-helix repeat protein
MRKLIGYITVCATLGVLAPLGLANAAGASTTRHVHPGESIQHAVNLSAPGDTVVVESGTYAQTVRISTSHITLIGRGATIVPPASPDGFRCLDHGQLAFGICIGARPHDPSPVLDGVTVQGFTVKNFPASGIFAVANMNLTIRDNTAIDNEEYGIAAFGTVGTRFLNNTATGAEEANFYLGDSPGANALVRGNVSHDGALGIFIRNSDGLTVQDNDMRDNCAGLLVLADAPGPAGNVLVRHNTILRNNHACPPAEGPPFSGIGIALLGAHDVSIQANVIQGNVPSGPTFAGGGVVVSDQGPGSTAPMNNKVSHNVFTGNTPDINDTGTGSGNVYRNNQCGADPGACS